MEKINYTANLKFYEAAYECSTKLKILIKYFPTYATLKGLLQKLAEFSAMSLNEITKIDIKKKLKSRIYIKNKEHIDSF